MEFLIAIQESEGPPHYSQTLGGQRPALVNLNVFFQLDQSRSQLTARLSGRVICP